MRTRAAAVVAALVLGTLAAACGDDDDEVPDITAGPTTSESTTSTTGLEEAPVPEPTGGVVELTADPPSRLPAGPHTWQLAVTNTGEQPVTLTFSSGQDGDAVIETDDGTLVHRWSDGRFFDQAIHEMSLAPGETQTIELPDDLSAVEPGFYRVRLSLAVVEPPEPVVENIRITSAG